MTPLKVSIAGAVASFLLVLVVLELIRSRQLRERYALLQLFEDRLAAPERVAHVQPHHAPQPVAVLHRQWPVQPQLHAQLGFEVVGQRDAWCAVVGQRSLAMMKPVW